MIPPPWLQNCRGNSRFPLITNKAGMGIVPGARKPQALGRNPTTGRGGSLFGMRERRKKKRPVPTSFKPQYHSPSRGNEEGDWTGVPGRTGHKPLSEFGFYPVGEESVTASLPPRVINLGSFLHLDGYLPVITKTHERIGISGNEFEYFGGVPKGSREE